MLLQFNVRNAWSFKAEAILDLVANKDKSHEEKLIPCRKDRLLPVAAIYGANAAGKSNLFKALTSAIMFVRESVNMQINSPIKITPFVMDKEEIGKPTRFDFIFTYDGIKYEYGFLADREKVYEEYLYEYRSAKPSLIFERENVNEYHYTAALKKTMRSYEEKNTDNKLFLSTATAWNCQETKNAYKWFSEMIDTYDSKTIEDNLIRSLDSDKNEEIKSFAKNLLKTADFNISDYQLTVEEDESEDVFGNVRHWELKMLHTISYNGEMTQVGLPYQMESNGTKLFFSYSPAIYQALKKGKTITIDEIDNDLHPLLVQHLISIFNDPETNPNGAQLIFNTHDVELLDLDVLRRDQIYFVEKNNETGESELYSLSDFSPRKTENIQKGYMLGRFGAIPNIRGFEW